ncbi:DNA polymerase III subunit delta [Sphingosinicella sp.]|uniref:DNA polymerase III subunit delta n=1 Tax=Sphingosinicella sp. TaxID=1917971 RepID=UPI0040383058
MIVKPAQLGRHLADLSRLRLFLFYGPDESASRNFVPVVAAALGGEVERVDLTGAELKGDPAGLADEAASLSMFGGARLIVVDRAGDESAVAAANVLALETATNPVILLAGELKKSAALLKLVESSDRAIGIASYPVDERNAESLVGEQALALGLRPGPGVAARIAVASAGNRGIIVRELEKYAVFLDAAPDTPKPLDHETVDAIGADVGEGDLSRLLAAVAGGDSDQAETELARLRAEGKDGVQLIRAALRRMTMLARLRAEVERGRSVGAVMASSGKSIFYKEQGAIQAELGRWRAENLAKAIARLIEAERQIMMAGGPGPVAAEAELLAIARQAARRR